MPKKPITPSWIHGLRRALLDRGPAGWKVMEGIQGAGVQLLPDDPIFLQRNASGAPHALVGPYKVIFEVFRLTTTGNLKISARISAKETQPLFHEFNGIARALKCPQPKGSRSQLSQSVAAWPANPYRQSFASTDYEGMARWVREFLHQPPADFTLFSALARNLLQP